jgi:uncharacterized protein
MIFFIITILSISLLLIFLGFYLGFRFLHPHRVSSEDALKSQLEKGEIPKEYLERKKEPFLVPSSFGYNLAGFYFPGDGEKIILFCHGISWNKLGSVKYLDRFLKENWTIFLYDHRGAGESGGKYPSFGFYEKQDLGRIKEFAKEKFPNTKIWGLFGESMGGATVMQYAKMDSEIQFVVAVCPFTSLSGLMTFHLGKVGVPKLLLPIILFFSDLYFRMVGDFSASQVTPGEDICSTKVPLFLSHGNRDELVPFEMGAQLYEKRNPLAPTVFFEGNESGHTPYLYLDHKEEFEKILENFLNKYSKL